MLKYYEWVNDYQKWRKWTTRWLFSLEVLFEFKDTKNVLANQVKKLFENPSGPIDLESTFSQLINIYIDDIQFEFDPYSNPPVNGGRLRDLIKNILFDIYQTHPSKQAAFMEILKQKEHHFQTAVANVKKTLIIPAGRVPIVQNAFYDLMETYAPIQTNSFPKPQSLQ